MMALMAIVCGLQWIWFKRIVEMAGGKDDKSKKKSKKE